MEKELPVAQVAHSILPPADCLHIQRGYKISTLVRVSVHGVGPRSLERRKIMDNNQSQSQATETAPAPEAAAPTATAPAAQAPSKVVERLSYLGLGVAQWTASGVEAIRRSQRQQAFVGLLFVAGLVWLFGSVAYHHFAKNFPPQASSPTSVAPAPEPTIIRVPVPMEAQPEAKAATVLFADGWVWDTPMAVKANGKTYVIPKSQRSRFDVSEAEEIPRPASLPSWEEMPKEESEGLTPVKVYLVG